MHRRRRPPSCAVAPPPPVGDGHGEVDWLSQLPDDRLSQILSFLSVQEAVRTKLLSRRWKHLYPANPTLRFFPTEHTTANYVSQVDRTIKHFVGHKIKALDLIVDEHIKTEYASNVDEWIHLASLAGAESIALKVDNSPCSRYMFPLHLLHVGGLCHLKHLHLLSCSIPPFVSAPGPIVSLRTLQVEGSYSRHQNHANYKDIPYYFPYLENLSFGYSTLPNLRHLCSRLCYLKSLVVKGCWGPLDLDIHDATLTKFIYHASGKKFSLKGLNCLRYAEIGIKTSAEDLALILSNLSEGAPQLESLSVYKMDFRFPVSISTFRCLKSLKFSLNIADINNIEIQHLLNFLQVAPFLQKLSIILHSRIYAAISSEWSDKWLEEQLLLQQERNVSETHHPLSHLKEVEISCLGVDYVCFTMKEIVLIINLLKTAPSIEKMIVRHRRGVKNMELLSALAQYKSQVKFVVRCKAGDASK